MSTERDPFKLTSIDEKGSRIGIIPAEVRGKFRKWRTRVHFLLIIFFLLLPWIKIDGHQALLLNIPQREFNFFGVLLRAHDAPLVFLVFAILVMGLAFATAIWGRGWCGWACPQTVFIDFVFRRIEHWVEGDYIQRRRMQRENWDFKTRIKNILKWILFVFASSLIAHSFVAYFVGSNNLLDMIQGSPKENWQYFLLISVITGLILFDFAWFREQFCVIMCPYGRIQSVLLSSNSLAIVYDEKRGEPRRQRASLNEKSGDCVSCNRCIEVCPTRIDIREGLQMECIACTACADACDEIMAKVKKPPGLIAYRTLDGKPKKYFKLKTLFYGFGIFLSVTSLAYNLITREPLNIAVLRGTEAPFIIYQGDNGENRIRNHFRLHLTNQTDQEAHYRIELEEQNDFQMILAQNPITLRANSSETVHFFVHVPAEKIIGVKSIKIALIDSKGVRFVRELTFVGPAK